MVELIICEKPAQAEKIAEALADKKPTRKLVDKVAYYSLTHNGKEILVGCAVGHLFSVAENKKKGFTYPSFDLTWKPIFEIKKKSAFAKKYYDVLKQLAAESDSFVVACDFDVEGSTIGWNCIRFICNKKDAKRMKFSTLTRDELRESYANASPHLDFNVIEAGTTRHLLDWSWGINLSRALMSSIKKAGSFKLMSIGRVQGPALKVIVDREKEIKSFKPVAYWQLQLTATTDKEQVVAWHKEDQFWEKPKAESILKKTKGQKAVVTDLQSKEYEQAPPNPFDLTTLQTESYRCFGISPKETLSLAQELYTAGLISYPRTSSQQIPNSIDFKKVLQYLADNPEYGDYAKNLLKRKNLAPNNGKKTDPAHPAIYPTGEKKKLEARAKKVYDIIVRRFLATFAEPAKRLTLTATIDVNGEPFIARGTTTKEKGWHVFYGVYAKFKEEELPLMHKGQTLEDPEVTMLEDATKPPKRYTQASLIKDLEAKNLGTKSTRAAIIDALYERNYVTEKAIEATELGMKTIEILEKYVPEVIDEQLTRHFEEDMELIQEEKKKGDQVLQEAQKELTVILEGFRKKEEMVGKELLTATRETERIENTIGKCTQCVEGMLMLRKGRFGLFIACNKYPDCKTTFSVPKNAKIKPIEDKCPACNAMMVMAFRYGKRPFKYCINKTCPPKLAWIEEQKKKKAAKEAEQPAEVKEVKTEKKVKTKEKKVKKPRKQIRKSQSETEPSAT